MRHAKKEKTMDLKPKILANGTPKNSSLPIDPIAATLLVRRVQEEVDSSDCHVLGTNLWIIIRNEIYYSISREVGRFFDAMIGKPGFSGRVYSGQPLAVPQTFRLMEGAKRSALICGDDRRADDLKGGVIFCEVPADYTQFIDGFAVNCFADSMIELMRESSERHRDFDKALQAAAPHGDRAEAGGPELLLSQQLRGPVQKGQCAQGVSKYCV